MPVQHHRRAAARGLDDRASDVAPERTPVTPSAAMVLALQRTAGNHAVQGLLARGGAPRLLRTIDPGFVAGMQPGAALNRGQQAELQKLVQDYNDACPGDATRASLQTRQGLLDRIEHRIYAWFEDVKDALDPESASVRDHPTLRGMFDLMNAVQRDHTAVIGELVNAGEQVWVADEVTDVERGEIDQIWADITSGTGAFQFQSQMATADGVKDVTPEAQERFQTEIFAALARLISRPKGRALLKALKEGHPAMGGTNIEFMLPALYKMMGTEGYADVPYVGAKATETNPIPSKLTGDGGVLGQGGGSTSGVAVSPGVHDASMMDFDASGGLVPSPVFVGVGHELIHASHFARGTYPGVHGASMPALPEAYGGDVEEFLTISSPEERQAMANQPVRAAGLDVPFSQLAALNTGLPTEAEIRAEHGIGIRHGHETTANPFLYPGAARGEDPGIHVKDPVEWAAESWPVAEATEEKRAYDRANAPAAPAAAPVPAPGRLDAVRAFFARIFS